MQPLPLHGARERFRTLAVHRDTIWMWPGIPLTLRRGAEIVPIEGEVINFWVTRLHGREALYADSLSTVSRAARVLTMGGEVKAQHILDALRLTTVSQDGAALMKAVSSALGIAALDVQVDAAPQTWNARDIALHGLLFKEHVVAARILAKGGAGPWDEAKHPRWPAGAPESQGGRFAPSVGSGGSSLSVAPPGFGHNGGPPLEDPPEIPETEPPPKLRYAFIKVIARWIAAATKAMAQSKIKALMTVLSGIAWIAKYRYDKELQANRDEPKTFEELARNHGPGYHEHHIVEQTPAAGAGFSQKLIQSPENKVIIPAMKHRDITRWYNTKNPDFGGKSPRNYLRGKSWKVRYDLGVQKLKDFGVLKD